MTDILIRRDTREVFLSPTYARGHVSEQRDGGLLHARKSQDEIYFLGTLTLGSQPPVIARRGVLVLIAACANMLLTLPSNYFRL